MCFASAANGEIVCFVITGFECTFQFTVVLYILTNIQNLFVDDIV